MASSYEKVFRLLNETDRAKEIRGRVRKALEGARITGWKFNLTEYEGRPFVAVTFQTSYHHKASFSYYGYDARRVNGVSLDLDDHWDKTELKELVHRHFGHGVPTFFCRKEVVLNGCEKERGRVKTESFLDWFVTTIGDELSEAKRDAEKRLWNGAEAIVEEASFMAEKESALVNAAKQDIIRTMRKYSSLGEVVLRDALREFTVADVLEG